MCKVLSYLSLYLQSLVQCLTHLLFITWMDNFVAKSSKNSVLTWFHWHSWVLPLVWNTFFLLAFEFSHYCSLIPPFSFALSRPVLSQVCTLSPPLIPCCSLCVSSACLLCQLSKYQGFQKVLILVPKHASLSLGNLIHLHRFNYYLLSEEYTGAIPGLSLKYQTLTFNDL